MTHPNPEIAKRQNDFLASCPPKDRRFHEIAFIVGNATYRYHQEAEQFTPTETEWNEFLEGLQEPLKSAMKEDGFEKNRYSYPFTRYVNEKNDNGLQEYLKKNVGPKILEEFNDLMK